MCVGVCAVSTSALTDQRCCVLLELELQVASCELLVWVLGTKLSQLLSHPSLGLLDRILVLACYFLWQKCCICRVCYFPIIPHWMLFPFTANLLFSSTKWKPFPQTTICEDLLLQNPLDSLSC